MSTLDETFVLLKEVEEKQGRKIWLNIELKGDIDDTMRANIMKLRE